MKAAYGVKDWGDAAAQLAIVPVIETLQVYFVEIDPRP
jgi:hypothetical protein